MRGVTGEVQGLAPVVVDDMITTGGTVEAAVRAVLDAGCRPEVTLAATHGLFVGAAAARLRALPVRRVLTTDTLAAPAEGLPLERVTVASLLAEAISRLHVNRSLGDLIVHA